ncbi:hypothetical protein VLK31_35925 [Variovorax sp. H27-G14]|uniref:hypothetical protein n=1 Tax=Variovorax sp. H27-G14 TaxID=3111914 RepID=UPI0038FCEB01
MNSSFANLKNFTEQTNEKNGGARAKGVAQGFFILAAVCLSTSTYAQQAIDDQYVLKNTKLSISPSGDKILITYGLKSENPMAFMVDRRNEKFVSKPFGPVNKNLRYLGFSSNDENLLEVSRDQNITTLNRLNIETGQRELIYREGRDIWMPKEIGPDDYAYFQALEKIPTQGVWVRQQGMTQKVLFAVPDRFSSRLNLTEDSLYVMNWTSPRSFLGLAGKVPPTAEKFASSPNVWEINCSNSVPLQCSIDKLSGTKSGYLTVIEITKGLQTCTVPGQWFEMRELKISDNGSHVIFHAQIPGRNGLRSIYSASYAENECRLDIVFSERDGKWELQ